MFKKQILLFTLFCCFTFASALNANLTKTLFTVNGNNQLSYKLLHTKNGVITYSVEPALSGPTPQYLLLNPTENLVTPILQDLMDSCGHKGATIFDRLHYHVLSSTLVYYCTANNSLLVLDENDYTVQDSIPTHLNETFAEAKLSSDDGYGIFILAMGSLYSTNQSSHLVYVNLLSESVVSSVSLAEGLDSQEFVTDFASKGDFRYILTTKVNDTAMTVAIHFLYLEVDDYEIFQIINFTNLAIYPQERIIASLYCVGNYLVTNNDTDLIFVNTESEVVYRARSLAIKSLTVLQPPYLPGFVAQDGGQDVYAQFRDGQMVKYSVDGYTISQQEVGMANDMQIAFGTNETNPLLFTISLYQQTFTIQDLLTNEVILQSVAGYQQLYLTNSTYAIMQSGNLYIYNLSYNTHIETFKSVYQYYFDEKTNSFYFFQENYQNYTCQLNRINLETASLEIVYNGNLVFCGTVVQLRTAASGFVEFVSALSNGNFAIQTETYGLVQFNLPYTIVQNIQGISIDFNTLSTHFLHTIMDEQIVHVQYYEYDNATGFTEASSYDIEHVISVYSFKTIGIGRVVAIGYDQDSFTLIDLNFGSGVTYSTSTMIMDLTTVADTAQRQYLIFSDSPNILNLPVTQPTLFDSNGVSHLPGSNNYTVQAASAGTCSYCVVDGYGTSVSFARFYNICPQNNMSIISQ